MTCPLEPWSVRYRRMTGAGVSEGSASLGATKASRKAKTQLSYESVLRTRVRAGGACAWPTSATPT